MPSSPNLGHLGVSKAALSAPNELKWRSQASTCIEIGTCVRTFDNIDIVNNNAKPGVMCTAVDTFVAHTCSHVCVFCCARFMVFLGGASKRFQECPSSSEGLLVWVVATSEGLGILDVTNRYPPKLINLSVCRGRMYCKQKTQVQNICQCKRVPFSLCWPRAAPSRANPLVNEIIYVTRRPPTQV